MSKKDGLRHRFGNDVYDRIWNLSDDAIHTSFLLSDIYDNVPPEIDCYVEVLELHGFPPEKREAVLEWLNREEKSSEVDSDSKPE